MQKNTVKSELGYMKERYKEMHNIKYKKDIYIEIIIYKRVYRNRGKPHCDTPFF